MDLDPLREPGRRHPIGVRAVDPLDQQIPAVGRGAEVPRDPRAGQGLDRTGQRDPGQLDREVVVEQRLVVRVRQEVLVRAGRGRAAEALLDHRARGHPGLLRLGSALRGDERRNQAFAVRQPRRRITRREAQSRAGEPTRAGFLDLDHPQLNPVRRRVGERDLRPSGDQRMFSIRASAGRPLTSVPVSSSSRFRVRSTAPVVRLRPSIEGLMRMPASLSSRSASSAIGG